MSSDEAYNSFLSKANEPISSSQQTSQSTSQAHSKHDPTSSSAAVPASINTLLSSKPTYTSDTDSPFEPVFFSYSGDGLPSADQFKQCLIKSKSASAKGAIEELSAKDFDPRGEHEDVIKAVREAGEGDVKVYRVEGSGARVEYYVLSVSEGGRKLVGVRTEAVES